MKMATVVAYISLCVVACRCASIISMDTTCFLAETKNSFSHSWSMRKCETVNASERIQSRIINPSITLYSDPNLYIEVTEMNSMLAYK